MLAIDQHPDVCKKTFADGLQAPKYGGALR